MKRFPGRQLCLVAILLLAYSCTHYFLYSSYRAPYSYQAAKRHWQVPTPMIEALAGEFKGLAANFFVLEIGALLGTELVKEARGKWSIVKKEHDWETVLGLFNHAIALDPHFRQTYTLAQGWLPWDGGMVAETQHLLRIAREHRPWDWRPGHYLGFNSYYFLHDHGEAGKIFLETSRTVPDAPPFLAILGARLAQKGGETAAAIVLIKSILAASDGSVPENPDLLARLQALEGVLVIEKAVHRYQAEFDKKPKDLADLTASGLLASLPPNPYGLPYCLDRHGAIYFDNPDCLTEDSSL